MDVMGAGQQSATIVNDNAISDLDRGVQLNFDHSNRAIITDSKSLQTPADP
jgi:hypothetical protein